MEDFKEKYGLLVKYMLPSVNRCIDKIEFDGFVSGGESLAIDNPKDEFEKRMNDKFNEYITPKIKISLKERCKRMRGIDSMGLKGDIFGKLTEIHSTYFKDRSLNANVRYIDIVPFIK